MSTHTCHAGCGNSELVAALLLLCPDYTQYIKEDMPGIRQYPIEDDRIHPGAWSCARAPGWELPWVINYPGGGSPSIFSLSNTTFFATDNLNIYNFQKEMVWME